MSYDVFVVGGGPSGATAAEDLARAGKKVAMLDRAGRIKPCGGAIPPRLIRDFAIPDDQIVARIECARMISPTGRSVDIHIENGFVGMVDREHFDEFLRVRAAKAGAERLTGTYLRIERDAEGTHVVWREKATGEERRCLTKLIIGADGARSDVARDEVPGGDKIPYVIAYHEIIKAPEATQAANADYDPKRCDVVYDGRISPDFYGWVFPHGDQASVGMGTGKDGVDLKRATADLRAASGLAGCETIRKEGAPIWFDTWAIPKSARNSDEAHAFINHLLKPEVAAGISSYVAYATANQAARPLVDPEIANDPAVYPPEAITATLVNPVKLPDDAQRERIRAWTSIKSGR